MKQIGIFIVVYAVLLAVSGIMAHFFGSSHEEAQGGLALAIVTAHLVLR